MIKKYRSKAWDVDKWFLKRYLYVKYDDVLKKSEIKYTNGKVGECNWTEKDISYWLAKKRIYEV